MNICLFQTDEVSIIEFFHKKEGLLLSAALELLRQEGALDVYFLPVYKNKTYGYQVHILFARKQEDFFIDLVTRHFSPCYTLTRQTRYKLFREFLQVEFANSWIGIKCGYTFQNGVKKYLQVVPEYEDCKELAKKLKQPLKEIYEQARIKAFHVLNSKQ